MTLSVTHKFHTTVPDGPDSTLVKPSNWNDTHNITAAAVTLLGNSASVAGNVSEVLLGSGLSFSGNTLNASGAVANPTNKIGLTTVNGVATTAMRSDAVPALDQTIGPTMTGNWLFVPASGNGPAISSSTNGTGLTITMLPPTLTTSATPYYYNHINITDSNVITGTSAVGNGLTVDLQAGGAIQGGRQALTANAYLTGTQSSVSANNFIVGAAFGSFANAFPGGSVGGERGQFIALNPVVSANSVATNLNGIKGMEIDIVSSSVSSMVSRVGIDIVLDKSYAAGSTNDRGIQFTGATSIESGWANGIVWDSQSGSVPTMASTGTLIATIGSQTIGSGVDLSSATINTAAFKSSGFNVDGSGTITSAKIIGGSAAAQHLTIQTSSSSVASGDLIGFFGGNNGATRYGFVNASTFQCDGTTGFYASQTQAGLLLKDGTGNAYGAINSGASGHYTTLNAPSSSVGAAVTFFQARDATATGGDANWGYLNNDLLQLTNRANTSNYAQVNSVGCLLAQNVAIPAGGTTGTGVKMTTTSNFGIFFGSGAPTLTAAQGSIYMRSDGSSASTRTYVMGSAAWINLVAAS